MDMSAQDEVGIGKGIYNPWFNTLDLVYNAFGTIFIDIMFHFRPKEMLMQNVHSLVNPKVTY